MEKRSKFVSLIIIVAFLLGFLHYMEIYLIVAMVLGISVMAAMLLVTIVMFLLFIVTFIYYLLIKGKETQEYGSYRIDDIEGKDR